MQDKHNQSEIVSLLTEIRDWMRAGFFEQVGSLLSNTLDDDKKRRAYQMADGTATVKEVCKACSMSPNSVLRLWNAASKRGLMEVLPGGKRRRIFDLRNFGLLQEIIADSTEPPVPEGEG